MPGQNLTKIGLKVTRVTLDRYRQGHEFKVFTGNASYKILRP